MGPLLIGILTGRTMNNPRARQLDLLVAEDNAINQRVVTAILEGLGHQCTIAHNGREAVDQVMLHRFDAVLMDIQMPEMDGVEAAAAIRALEPEQASLPIIALTAHTGLGDREHYIANGFDDYVPKPIDVRVLSDTLMRVVDENPQHGSDQRLNQSAAF